MPSKKELAAAKKARQAASGQDMELPPGATLMPSPQQG
jgi:hypothetical protein